MSGNSDLTAFIERVKSLGTATQDIAAAAVAPVRDVVRESAAAGRSPNGATWAPGKEGQPVLVNAAKAVECRAIGSTLQLRLVATETGSQKAQAIQHWGTKKMPARPILPEAGVALPKPIVDALTKTAGEVLARKMGAA
jgi:hypothetical protein